MPLEHLEIHFIYPVESFRLIALHPHQVVPGLIYLADNHKHRSLDAGDCAYLEVLQHTVDGQRPLVECGVIDHMVGFLQPHLGQELAVDPDALCRVSLMMVQGNPKAKRPEEAAVAIHRL